MATRCYRGRMRRPVHTTLGKAPALNDNDPIDLSHLRKPIDTSVYGLSHVLKLFETATDEVRRYISYECDIIYECRACRTLFRSLGNFILHKRCYCQEVFQPTSKFSNVDFEMSDTEISYKADRHSKKETSDSDESQKKPKKIETVLQKIAEKRENLKISNEVASRELSKGSKSDDSEPVENKLFLERIESTTDVVYQTIPKSSVGTELMKSEAMEIHSILNNNEAILSSDGKLFTFGTDKKTSNIASKKLHCPVCNLKFSTKKTLTFHIKYKHNETRLVYICPECKDTFANAWCVFRHLYKVHRKNTNQIRKLRDYVHSSAVVRKQEGFTKKDNVSADDSCRENQWSSGLEGDPTCADCGKKFERKAALHAHLLRCSKRIVASSNVKRNSEERSPPKQKTIGASPKGSDKRKSGVVRRMVKKTNVSTIEKVEDKTVLEKTAIEEIIFGKAKEGVTDLPIVVQSDDDEDTLGFSNNHDKESNDVASIDNSSQLIETPLVECISIEDESNDSIVASKPETRADTPEEITVQVISVSPDVVNLDATIEDSCDSVELIEIKEESGSIHSNLENDAQLIPNDEKQEIAESQTTISETENRKMKKRKRVEDVPSLRIKSQAYISWENSKCNSCDLKFVSHYYLMKHMALHFNWQRFQCSRCMFTCYDKKVCVRHVQSEHRIDQRILDNFVVTLETVASAELSSDFTPIDLDRYCSESNGAKHGLDLSESEDVKKVKESPKELDKQDPMVRKMIMEVIFGSDVQANFVNSSTSAITRPTRNRTSVRELQTDFVYDMNETDTEIDAPDHRIKPIKIVKNNEFDFKVVKEDGFKKRKSC